MNIYIYIAYHSFRSLARIAHISPTCLLLLNSRQSRISFISLAFLSFFILLLHLSNQICGREQQKSNRYIYIYSYRTLVNGCMRLYIYNNPNTQMQKPNVFSANIANVSCVLFFVFCVAPSTMNYLTRAPVPHPRNPYFPTL